MALCCLWTSPLWGEVQKQQSAMQKTWPAAHLQVALGFRILHVINKIKLWQSSLSPHHVARLYGADDRVEKYIYRGRDGMIWGRIQHCRFYVLTDPPLTSWQGKTVAVESVLDRPAAASTHIQGITPPPMQVEDTWQGEVLGRKRPREILPGRPTPTKVLEVPPTSVNRAANIAAGSTK